MGETVALSDNLSSSDLEVYLENQKINLNSKNLRIKTDKINWYLIPAKALYDFIGTAMKKYPDFSKKEFDDREFDMISKHIISIKSKEDANTKRFVIFEFYNFLLSKDVEKFAKDYLKNKRPRGVSYYGANALEIWLTGLDPLGGFKVNQARNQAVDMVQNQYPGLSHDNNDEVNAFKHCAWNALSVQELVSATWYKWGSLERARKFTCAHEYFEDSNGDWVQSTNDANAMDLYNNLVGRTYMYETVNQHWWGTSNNPSNSQIQSAIASFSKAQKSNSGDIFSMSGSLNWDSVGNWTSAMDYHTPISSGLVYLP